MIISPTSFAELPLTSDTVAVFVTSNELLATSVTTVGSSGVAVSGSSLMSVTSFVLPGLLEVAETTLITAPLSTSDCVITYEAV